MYECAPAGAGDWRLYVTKKKSGADEVIFLPLGGVGEIGMNLALYGLGSEADRKWLMVDCGVSFAGPDLPGVDLLLPDISYIEAYKDDLVGILITHAHEDHYGAIYDLWPRLGVPVYMTPFAAALPVPWLRTGSGKAPVHSYATLPAGCLYQPGSR